MSLFLRVAEDVTTAAGKARKFIKGKPKPAQKVHIISDEVTKIPGTLNLATGTKIFKDIGGGIRVVQPGANTRLGKLGVETVTTFPKEYFGGTPQPLISLQFKGAKSAMPLQTPQEVKSTLEFVEDIQKLEKQAKNPIYKIINTVKNAIQG